MMPGGVMRLEGGKGDDGDDDDDGGGNEGVEMSMREDVYIYCLFR